VPDAEKTLWWDPSLGSAGAVSFSSVEVRYVLIKKAAVSDNAAFEEKLNEWMSSLPA
jgi:hypothetical protein